MNKSCLLLKCEQYGSREIVLKMFRSNLEIKYQYNQLGKRTSRAKRVLGPLLFILYLNNIPFTNGKNLKTKRKKMKNK